jgi:hypothetical protein
MNKDKRKGVMIPRERGIKGLSIFIIFDLPILVLIEKSGCMRLLGRPCGYWIF